MNNFISLAVISVLAIPLATATSAASISWIPCLAPEAQGTNTLCGTFQVPLSYAHPQLGSASLAVAKYSNTTSPRFGTIWLNPGGPGNAGVPYLWSHASVISSFTGGHYDIAAFDPRGVGSSTPTWNCYHNASEEAILLNAVQVEFSGNLTNSSQRGPFVNALQASEPTLDEAYKHFASVCLDRNLNLAQYVGTSAVARDMVALTDVTDGPGAPVHYWGTSYGTLIGSYLVNMFPNRVGKIILDGNVDPKLYAQSAAYSVDQYSSEDVELVYTGFVDYCASRGTSCALTANGTSSDAIRQAIQTIIQQAYDYHSRGGNISSYLVRSTIFNQLYSPSTWDAVFAYLVALQTQMASIAPNASASANPSAPPSSTYVGEAIWCGDAMNSNYATPAVIDSVIDAAYTRTQMFGSIPLSFPGSFCHRWPARAVERFAGPWNHTLSNRILVIGNTADPITPRRFSVAVANMLGPQNAVFLEQRSYGHSSTSQKSSCTRGWFLSYFMNNTLPSAGTICEPDSGPMPPLANDTASSSKSLPSGSGSRSSSRPLVPFTDFTRSSNFPFSSW